MWAEQPCFTFTIPGCHYTNLIPNPTKIFLGRYIAALNAGAANIFCSFTNMDFVISILLKMFSSVDLTILTWYMPRVIWQISSSQSLGQSGTTSLASILSHAYVLWPMPFGLDKMTEFVWLTRESMARSSLLFPVLSGGEYLLHIADTMRTQSPISGICVLGTVLYKYRHRLSQLFADSTTQRTFNTNKSIITLPYRFVIFSHSHVVWLYININT